MSDFDIERIVIKVQKEVEIIVSDRNKRNEIGRAHV